MSHDASAAGNQRLEGGDHRVVAFEAHQHQILVESILHGPGIGYSQNRIAVTMTSPTRFELVG